MSKVLVELAPSCLHERKAANAAPKRRFARRRVVSTTWLADDDVKVRLGLDQRFLLLVQVLESMSIMLFSLFNFFAKS